MADKPSVRWYYSGQVIPRLPLISLDIPRAAISSSFGFSYEIEGRIQNSLITATVALFERAEPLDLRNSVTSVIQGPVDLAGLVTGAGLDVHLETARAESGEWQVFDGYIPALKVEGTVELPMPLVVSALSDVQAQIMLADFRQAMRFPVQTGFFCYRVADAAMQAFKSSESMSDHDAWVRMRAALRVERSAIDRMKPHADWARHGKPGVITDPERLMLFRTAKAIIERYLEYLSSGRHALGETVPSIA